MTFKHIVYALVPLTGGLLLFGSKVVAHSTRAAEEAVKIVQEHKQDTKKEVTELRLDVKALYHFMVTRQPQPRLEAPVVTDAGATE